MKYLSAQIVRFVDAAFPGFVACEFLDATGSCHTIIDKVPVLSLEDLDSSTAYPRPGSVGCEVMSRWRDMDGRELVRVTTARPWSIESTEGVSEFVIVAEQLESK
jgi:hypothetical protein